MHEKILFVDDEPQVLEGIERLLYPDFRIDTATTGAEALAKLRDSGPYAVVVCDMRMPEMDGIQLLCKIKVKSPETIRLMLTGNTDQPTAIKAVNEGNVFRFLTKPCEEDLLKRELNSALVHYRLTALHEQLVEREVNPSSDQPVKKHQVVTHASPLEIGQRLQDLVPGKGAIRMAGIGCAAYIGEVIGEDSEYLVQSISPTSAIAHSRNLLSRIPKIGEFVRIQYSDGTASVFNHEAKGK